MAVDHYDPTTAKAIYLPDGASQTARLWVREQTLHNLSDIGLLDFFEGPGSDPTALADYAPNKLWFQVQSGITESVGLIRSYSGGTASDIANWPISDRGALIAHIGGLGAELFYVWTTAIAGDPGTGRILADNADLSLATNLHLSKTDRSGQSVNGKIAIWNTLGASAFRGVIGLGTTGDIAEYLVGAAAGMTDQGTYWQVPISGLTVGAPLEDKDSVGVSFSPAPAASSNLWGGNLFP